VVDPHIDSQNQRGREYVAVTIVMTISAPDVAQALTAAWDLFQHAAGDAAGWDMARAAAEVRPEEPDG